MPVSGISVKEPSGATTGGAATAGAAAGAAAAGAATGAATGAASTSAALITPSAPDPTTCCIRSDLVGKLLPVTLIVVLFGY